MAQKRESGKLVTGMSQEALELLSRYDWPGNVRELAHVIERSVVLAHRETIGLDELWGISDVVVEQMGPWFPELPEHRERGPDAAGTHATGPEVTGRTAPDRLTSRLAIAS